MDATPNYMPLPSAACRIAATFPAAKIIAVLRDPTKVRGEGRVERRAFYWLMSNERCGEGVELLQNGVGVELSLLTSR